MVRLFHKPTVKGCFLKGARLRKQVAEPFTLVVVYAVISIVLEYSQDLIFFVRKSQSWFVNSMPIVENTGFHLLGGSLALLIWEKLLFLLAFGTQV